MNGRGVYLFNSDKKKAQNSLYYVGEFQQGVAQGQGRMVLKDGTAYNGSFVHNQLHCGAATIQYANGDQYDGEVEQGKKGGTGTYIYRNGDTYVGPFKNDVKYTNIEEGETGSLVYEALQVKYTGPFKQDQKVGKGVLEFG